MIRKYRAKPTNFNKYVYGDIIKIQDTYRIREYTKYHWNDYLVEEDSIAQFTNMYDKNCDEIYLGDKVDLFGMNGNICFECGSFGIGFKDGIDYNLIQAKMDETDWCCGNKYNGCFNDNFLSLYELYNAFNGEGDYIDVLEVIKED